MRFSFSIVTLAVGLAALFSLCGTGRSQISLTIPPATEEQVPTEVPSPPSLLGDVPRGIKSNEKPLLVRPEFLPGNTYRFVTRTELKTAIGGAGYAVVEQQARFDVRVRVDGKKGIVIKARTERLDVQLQSGGRTVVYHSLKPEDQATLIGKHFQSALYRSLDFTLNEDLSVASTEEGGRAISESPLPGLPRFGPDELRQLLATIPQGFSAKPVHPGESWELRGSRSVAGAGTLNFAITYRLTGPANFEDNQCLGIEFSGQLGGEIPIRRSDDEVADGGVMGLQGGGIRGRILFDPLDKMPRFIEQSIDLSLAFPVAQGEVPQAIPVQQSTTIRLLHVVATP